ncbi:sulfite exporter TauE/SafE family protein [Thalassospiraceae bacterium LMO-SO8]|nr:sulfite exporter TauE/SafE family protein [Alphaproteobacteria bacterium LMO-S08]WND76293.1 sulfite exporter TauE/SafE family protein [Thalassospiraceae bacterium LMO-SO8]
MGILELTILAGALAGGFVSGLTGFGTGLTALAVWLTVIEPAVAAPLVVICSLISQFFTLPAIWHAISWPRVLPFIVGGVVGVPLGTMILPMVSVEGFKLFFAIFLVLYCAFTLAQRSAPKLAWGGKLANGIVGLGGGVLGGLTGLSGPLPTIWATLRGWSKDEKRGVFQGYNTAILLLAVVTQAIGGFMTLEVGRVALIAFPATVAGSWIGRKIYNRLGDSSFNQIVLALLMFSGLSMIVAIVWLG